MKKFQPTIKLGFALAVACAVLFTLPAGPSVQGKTGSRPTAASAAKVAVIVDIGRKALGCTGFGVCRVTLTVSSKSAVKAELSTTSDGKLTLALLSKVPDESQKIVLDEDVAIPAEAASKLGLKSATLLQGEYAFSASRAVLNARLLR
jgi:hypothetical protein